MGRMKDYLYDLQTKEYKQELNKKNKKTKNKEEVKCEKEYISVP